MSTMQNPISSGFDAASNAQEVVKEVDLPNKVAIVTGGYSAIGVKTIRALSSADAKVIVPAHT